MEDICTDQAKGEGVAKLYNSLYTNRFNIKECPYPCTFLKTTFGSKINWANTFELTFNRFIKTTKSYYAYRGLELLAEFGGYVGLFLGYSVLGLTDTFDRVLHLLFHRWFSKVIDISHKGQTNSKWFFQADVSSKKWTKKFDFTTFVDLFSSVFWKKVKTQKGHFEINWPLARTHNLIHTFHTQILHSIFQNYPRCTFACQSLDYIPIYSNSNKEQTQLLDCPPLQGMKSICSLSKSVSFNWYTERESFLPHTPLVKFMVAREELSLLPLNIPQNSPPNRPL